MAKKLTREAVETGNAGHLFDPEKKRNIEQGAPELDPILPNLAPATQSYLEMLTTKSYEDVIAKLEKYSGRPAAQMRLPDVMSGVINALQQIATFERGNEKKLTALALKEVLSLPEFELAKKEVEEGALKFDLSLGADKPTLKNAQEDLSDVITQLEINDQPDNPDELSDTEKLDQQMATEIDEPFLRRKLARVLFQGNAVNKFYLFNMLKTDLDEINPNLINLYGVSCAYIHVLYYATPDSVMPDNPDDVPEGGLQGSCQVITNRDGSRTIKASGANLPYLIHEIVKCIFDYFSMDIAPQEVLDKQTLSDETVEFLSGPQAYLLFKRFIPADDNNQRLIPFILRKFLRLPIDEIREVMAAGGGASRIMARLIRDSNVEYNDYIRGLSTSELSDTEGGAEPEGDDSGDEWKRGE